MGHGRLLQLISDFEGFNVDKSFIVDTVVQTEKTAKKLVGIILRLKTKDLSILINYHSLKAGVLKIVAINFS
jgi:hypothetical protein